MGNIFRFLTSRRNTISSLREQDAVGTRATGEKQGENAF